MATVFFGWGSRKRRLWGFAAVVVAVAYRLPVASHDAGVDPEAVDKAFALFWAAEDPTEAASRIDAVVASGVSFDDALARLREGRCYSGDVQLGRRDLTHRIAAAPGPADGTFHPYTIVIPDGYDPSREYQVRIQLHGGVGRLLEGQGRAGDAAGRLPGTGDEIYVLPNAWPQSMWWSGSQVDNISAILDRLKRVYNVDDNRVYMTGISDGGTGLYFFAFRASTPFASFLPLNGHMLVLANSNVGTDGDMFPGNAANKPFFAVNGGRDRLYPAAGVKPFMDGLERLGADVVFHVREAAGHNTRWWLQERAAFEQFVDTHPRDPLPDRLSWQTERVDRYNRFNWLIIDQLGHVESEFHFADSNLSDVRRGGVFPQSSLTGRVDLVHSGNTVEVSTEGVRKFTLLLSPSRFDFEQPVRVVVNGRVAFQDRVAPSVRTLVEWAARDNDRTALFGASLQIEVAK